MPSHYFVAIPLLGKYWYINIHEFTLGAAQKQPTWGLLMQNALLKFQGELQVLLIKGPSHFMDILAWFKWQRCWIRFLNIACMNGDSLIRMYEMRCATSHLTCTKKNLLSLDNVCLCQQCILSHWLQCKWVGQLLHVCECLEGSVTVAYCDLSTQSRSVHFRIYMLWLMCCTFYWRECPRINEGDILPGQ